MDRPNHPDVARLLTLLEGTGEDGCEAIGLLPMPSLQHCGYSCAPPNSLAFAATGGDGVHFSVLRLPEGDPTSWPVVMTVPMNFSRSNLIVGSDLCEFLGLGIRIGYFALDQLTYARNETVALLDRNVELPSGSDMKGRTLARIQHTFGCSPWVNHAQRITELQATFSMK